MSKSLLNQPHLFLRHSEDRKLHSGELSDPQQQTVSAVSEAAGRGRHAKAGRVAHDFVQQGKEVDHMLLVSSDLNN